MCTNMSLWVSACCVHVHVKATCTHNYVCLRSSRKGVEYLVKWKDLSYSHATWEGLGEECGLKNAPQAIKEYEALRRLMDPKKKEKKRGRKPKVVVEVSQECSVMVM